MLDARLRAGLRSASVAVLLALPGCFGDAIKANQTQLAQQQTQLDQLKQEVAAMQAHNAGNQAYAAAPGACDETVMREASRQGGERFAGGDFAHALAYYQDAANACPQNARAQLNLAHGYEAAGDAIQARAHYQLAAAASGDDGASREARDALARLAK